MLTLPVAAEFASSLSLLAVLVWSVPRMRARIPDAVIGLFFGVLTVLQMHAPIEMADGVIVDLRCITVGLAAALLRPAGIASCVAVAIAARLQIGGVGAASGIAGIALAALCARLWARQMASRALRPGWPALLVLAVAMSSHLGAVVLLPADVAWRFASDVAPYLLAVNVATVPVLAAIGLRGTSTPLGREAWLDEATGLLSSFGLRQSWAQREAADLPTRGIGLTLLALRHGRWTSRTFGGPTLDAAMGALRARLDAALPREAIVARIGPASVAILWPDIDEVGHHAISMGLARSLSDGPVALPDGYRLAVPLDTGQAWTRLDAELDALLRTARESLHERAARPAPQGALAA